MEDHSNEVQGIDLEFLRLCSEVIHPDTSPERLAELADRSDAVLAQRVAQNSKTLPETLLYLSRSQFTKVKRAVVWNSNCPAEALSYLSEDMDVDVRLGVAQNPNTPEDILGILAKEDSDKYIRAQAVAHLSINESSKTDLKKPVKL